MLTPFTRDDGRVVNIEVHWGPADPDVGITGPYIWDWDLPLVEPDESGTAAPAGGHAGAGKGGLR